MTDQQQQLTQLTVSPVSATVIATQLAATTQDSDWVDCAIHAVQANAFWRFWYSTHRLRIQILGILAI